MIGLMNRILTASGAYKKKILWAFGFSFLKSLLSHVPVCLAFVTLGAFLEGTADERLCLTIGAALLASVILQILCQHTADRLQSASGYRIFAEKRMALGAHLRKMPMGYFTEGNIGKISSVLSTDMVFVEENCMTALADMMSYVFAEGIMLVLLLVLNPWLGLAMAACVALAVGIARGMRKEAMADSTARQEQSENLTEAVLDFTEGIGIIKAYNLLGERSKELSDNFRKSCETSIQFEENHGPWQRRLNLVYGLGSVGILALALLLHTRGSLETTRVIGVMLFVFNLFGPLKALYAQSTRLTVMNSCMDRMEAVFAEEELADNGREPLPEKGSGPEIEFRNVTFAYAEKPVLQNVSFAVDPGQMVALVGPSGGGKSTVANLLARFWDVKSGEILLRGQDIRAVPLSELMDQISMVFQRVYLFQDTIYENIRIGKPDATREEVLAAAKRARCYDFIQNLPHGLDTMVGEGGESLSGGERQRISIARCILKDAPIVILDEATASVDADNESYIQQAITELCRGKTLLVIAHRLNTIRGADKILVIADGQVVQSGTHSTLMEQPGIYRNFVTVRERSRGWSQAG